MFNFSFDVNWLLFIFYKSSLYVFRMDCSSFTIKIFTAAKQIVHMHIQQSNIFSLLNLFFFNIDNASNNQTIQVKAMKRRQILDFLHYLYSLIQLMYSIMRINMFGHNINYLKCLII